MNEWIDCDMQNLPAIGTIAKVYLKELSEVYSKRVELGAEVEIIAHIESSSGTPMAVFIVDDPYHRYVRQAVGRCFKRKITNEEKIDRQVEFILNEVDGDVSGASIRQLIEKGFIKT